MTWLGTRRSGGDGQTRRRSRTFDARAVRVSTTEAFRRTSKIELCPPARLRRTNAAGVAFRPICFRGDASVEPKATAGGVFAELEFREFRAHGGALAPVRALKGTGIPSRDLSGTRPGLAAGGGCRREHQLGLTRGKTRGCSHRNRTRARVNARARGSLMVAYCVHPCRSRRRVGLDGPAPTDICGCRWSGIRRWIGTRRCRVREPHRRVERGGERAPVAYLRVAELRQSRPTSTFARRRAHAPRRRVSCAAALKARAHENLVRISLVISVCVFPRPSLPGEPASTARTRRAARGEQTRVATSFVRLSTEHYMRVYVSMR